MKKILYSACILFFYGIVYAGSNSYILSGVSTNYTADANCKGAWGMSSSSTETDLSGEGQTLTESTSDDMPSSMQSIGRFTTTVRTFAAADTEYLYATESDGNGFDISGADQPLTLACWVDFTDANPGADMGIIGKYIGDTNGRQYYLKYDDSDAAVKFLLGSPPDGSSYGTALGATDVAADQAWHHIAGVYNDTDMRIYVDGVLDSNGESNPAAYTAGIYDSDTAPFRVGAVGGDTDYFSGSVTQCIVFNRALSATEIYNLYYNGMRGTE